jgi:hypothetical protein
MGYLFAYGTTHTYLNRVALPLGMSSFTRNALA